MRFVVQMLCVALAVFTIANASHQVNFHGRTTLPQVEREVGEPAVNPKMRALHNFLADLERREEVETEKRNAGDCDAECLEKRAQELLPAARRFLSTLSDKVARGLEEKREEGVMRAVRGITQALAEARKRSLFERRDGIIKQGINPNNRDYGLRAAMAVRSAVQKRAFEAGRRQEMREVSAIADDLQLQAEKRAAEAERLGTRAVEDLKDSMKLASRAEHVRHFMAKEKAKRALAKITRVNKRTLAAAQVKRDMQAIKSLTADMKKRELARRSEVIDSLKEVAKRMLADKEAAEKRALTSSRISEGIAQVKRSIEQLREEKTRVLAHMQISEQMAAAKRSLEHFTAEQARKRAASSISEGIAKAKRTVEKRAFEEQEMKERALKKIAEGVDAAKRSFEKRKFQEKHFAEKRFVDSMDSLKRMAEEAKEKRIFETLAQYKRVMGLEHEKREMATRALEELKSAVEKRGQTLEERDLKAQASVKAVRSIGQNLEKALTKRAMEAKRAEELRELEELFSDDSR